MTHAQASPSPDILSPHQGVRPVNLRTDLAPLADLIETVFADSMDDNGLAAVREMRYLSKMGPGLAVLGRLNDLAVGISLGFVWIEDDRLVGNVSLYPANWPRAAGQAWIIANVGVYPDYQRRGIARQLMLSSMNVIRQRGGDCAILQVDADNMRAIQLYERLGFIRERAWTTWTYSRLSLAPPPLTAEGTAFITRRRRHEWRHVYELARRVRPALQGGIGWLRPLDTSLFRPSIWRSIADWFTMNDTERLVVRAPDSDDLQAVLWVQRKFAAGHLRLTLISNPDYPVSASEHLLQHVLRRYPGSGFVIEHPQDDEDTAQLLRRYHFRPSRTVWHMRWDVKSGL